MISFPRLMTLLLMATTTIHFAIASSRVLSSLSSRLNVSMTICELLEQGKMSVDAIGLFGGTTGDDRFLLVTTSGHVWDLSGSALDLAKHKVTLQEMTVQLVDEKWPVLKGHYNYAAKLRRDGAIIRYANEEWLVLLEEPGMALNQSLTHPKRPVSGSPRHPFLGTEQYRLVSSVATGKWYGISVRENLSLYEYTLDMEVVKSNSMLSFMANKKKQFQHVASNWRKKASYHKTRPVDRAFMDRNNQLYVIDNDQQLVYVYRMEDEKLVRTCKMTFDEFIDCGTRNLALYMSLWFVALATVIILLCVCIYKDWCNCEMAKDSVHNDQKLKKKAKKSESVEESNSCSYKTADTAKDSIGAIAALAASLQPQEPKITASTNASKDTPTITNTSQNQTDKSTDTGSEKCSSPSSSPTRYH